MKALVNFYTNEWFFAVPMTVMTLVAFLLVAWRHLLNVSAKTRMDRFLPELQSMLKRKGTKGAVALCRNERGLIPNVLYVAGLEASEQGVAAMRRSMASAVELEIVPRLNFLLAPILAVAKISTMVGLLGTVISMIGTFSKIGEATAKGAGGGGGNVGAQAESIGLALFATALGLLTAIPLVFMHVLFKDWIGRFETKMKASAQKLIVLVQNAKAGTLEDPLEGKEEPAAPVKETKEKPARGRRPSDADEDDDEEDDDDRRSSRRERARR